MNEKNAKRLEELSAIARDPDKLSKLLLDGFDVCRGLGEHFEMMNGSPQLKRLSNLAGDLFGIMHAQLSNPSPTIPATAIAASSSRFFDAVEKALENPELRADIILQPGVAMPAMADRPSVTATLATEPEHLEERRTEETIFPEGQTIPMGEPIEAAKLKIGPIPLAREIMAANAEPIPPPPDDWVPPPTKAPAAKKPKPAPTSGPPMF